MMTSNRNLSMTNSIRFGAIPKAQGEEITALLKDIKAQDALRAMGDADLMAALDKEAVKLKKDEALQARRAELGLKGEVTSEAFRQLTELSGSIEDSFSKHTKGALSEAERAALDAQERADRMNADLFGIQPQGSVAGKNPEPVGYRPQQPSDEFVTLEGELKRRAQEAAETPETPASKTRAQVLLEGLMAQTTYFCDSAEILEPLKSCLKAVLGKA